MPRAHYRYLGGSSGYLGKKDGIMGKEGSFQGGIIQQDGRFPGVWWCWGDQFGKQGGEKGRKSIGDGGVEEKTVETTTRCRDEIVI